MLKSTLDKRFHLQSFICFNFVSLVFLLVPHKPNFVTVHAISKTSINVHWENDTCMMHRFNLTGFAVVYQETVLKTSVSDWKRIAVDSNKTEAFLNDLKPFTTYTIRVMAFIATGDGIPSNLLDVKTLQGGKSDHTRSYYHEGVSALDFKDAANPRFGYRDEVFDLFIKTSFFI